MDPVRGSAVRAVGETASFVEPEPVAAPFLLAVSDTCAASLDVSPDVVRAHPSLLTGNDLIEGADVFATNYGGHQFGNWADQLGDGRAISIAEFVSNEGVRSEWQLKGAGMTPYSRFADGRAVLRSSVREFVASEVMASLGVPTTRALWIAGTGEEVMRDRFYDGNAAPESGAIVCRVSPSWIRFGHFELPAARGKTALVKELADFCMARDFPGVTSYADWFREICERTAVMIAHWQRVGFVHGVMNTDNMSVLGLTIDYGPYGFLDGFDPSWTPNTTDAGRRRYRFGQQPAIAFWNLQRLAMAISTLFEDTQPLQDGLIHYEKTFVSLDAQMQLAKLGLTDEADLPLVNELQSVMQSQELDFTKTYNALLNGVDLAACSYRLEPDKEALSLFVSKYQQRDRNEDLMCANNPVWVPHNWMLQELIDETQKCYDARSECRALNYAIEAAAEPERFQDQVAKWSDLRPAWALSERGCTDLSCSS